MNCANIALSSGTKKKTTKKKSLITRQPEEKSSQKTVAVMPAASSKQNPQNAPKEAIDVPAQLVAVVEKKIRNLEKRKLKLQQYRDMVSEGQLLSKDQVEAASHFDEVCSNLDFAKELQKTFHSTINENVKIQKKQAKRDSIQKHEQELGRIRDVLLLNNVLNNLGADHVRNDFVAGTNGAVKLTEDQVDHLDEFYKLVNPSRDDEEEDGEKEKSSASFKTKMTGASEHLMNYIKEEEKKVLGTTYKELKKLVNEIHKCGYLENIPAAPEEEAEDPEEGEGEEEAPPTETQDLGNVEEPAPEEEYIMVQQDQVPPPEAPEVISSLPPRAPSPQEEPAPISHVQPVVEHEVYPKPIEMPPPKYKSQTSDILATVQQGSFNFMQDSMLDYDSPHMDPAVVATGQSYLPSQSYSALNRPQAVPDQTVPQHQSLEQLTGGPTMELPMSDQTHPSQHTTHNVYESQTGMVSDSGYVMQSAYESQQQQHASIAQQQQQNLAHQGLNQQSLGQTSLGSQLGHTNQQASLGMQSLDGLSQTGQMMTTQQQQQLQQQQQQQQKMNELPEFPSPPVDVQLAKAEQEKASLQASMLGQHSAGMVTGTTYQSSLASPTLPEHPTSTMQHQTSEHPTQTNRPLTPISTMNASAPPFQMANSTRSSPQLQAMQQSAIDQSQSEMGSFPTADPTSQVDKTSERDTNSPKPDLRTSPQPVERVDSPVQVPDIPASDTTVHSSYSYTSYQSNSPYRGNGRSNPRGGRGNMGNSGYRGNRGMQYMGGRSTGRYPSNPNPNPRGPGGYNAYLPRDGFPQQRAPDLPYGNTSPNFNAFNRPQDPNFGYPRRVVPNRGSPRGLRGGPGGMRGQANFRGRGGSSGFKPQSSQVSV